MTEKVKIVCTNLRLPMEVEWGTKLATVAEGIGTERGLPYLAAYVNNTIRELDYRIVQPSNVMFVDITHFEGMRVYERTLFMTLLKAAHDLYPANKLKITQSVSRGFYCELEGLESSPEMVAALKRRMDQLIAAKMPIVRHKVPIAEALETYNALGMDDKIEILTSRPHLYVTVYKLDDMAGYFYGALAPRTDFIHLYDLRTYYHGLYIAVPKRTNPNELEPMVPQEKMFDVFQEYKRWVGIIGVEHIGALNKKIAEGDSGELIKIAEAFHERKIADIADAVAEAHSSRGARVVLVSGPSSSGKTTFSKRLGIQLRILGLTPVMISLDDYFLDREDTPRDENGDYDFETIDALDIDTFNAHLGALFEGKQVDIPRYDFVSGRRQWHDKPLQLADNAILVVEGIHALNPRLTERVADNLKFRIYISCLTSIAMDDLSRIPTTDNRLMRRMVRDNSFRGTSAASTLKRWASVRRGEERHIFPYQENADVMFNSSLFYEIPVLKYFVVPLLHQVPRTVEEYGEAQRLLKFLDNFPELIVSDIPPTSLLREFIGGSSFDY